MAEQPCTGTASTGKAVPRGAWGQPRAVGGTAAQTGAFPEAADTGDIIRGANDEHSSHLQSLQPLLPGGKFGSGMSPPPSIPLPKLKTSQLT